MISDGQGFIHEELDLKILILYILSKLSGPIDIYQLFDICKCDNAVGYFDYSQCLNDLIDNANIAVSDEDDECVLITGKGRTNVSAVGGNLPNSVRNKADWLIEDANEIITRETLVKTRYDADSANPHVELSLSDGVSDILNISVFCGDEKLAAKIRKNFKKNAEQYFNDILSMLSE